MFPCLPVTATVEPAGSPAKARTMTAAVVIVHINSTEFLSCTVPERIASRSSVLAQYIQGVMLIFCGDGKIGVRCEAFFPVKVHQFDK